MLVIAGLLTACAQEQPVTVVHHRQHVSPTMVAAPEWPADSFDQKIAAAKIVEGKQALDRGDLNSARAASEQALALWPVAIEGWEQLIDICGRQDDQECLFYAKFYQAKLVMLNGLPMRSAALGFQTVAENEEGGKAEGRTYDRKTLDMATRLWVFCSREDPAHSKAPEPTEPDFMDSYPYVPVILVIGIGAGLLTAVKGVANKQ